MMQRRVVVVCKRCGAHSPQIKRRPGLLIALIVAGVVLIAVCVTYHHFEYHPYRQLALLGAGLAGLAGAAATYRITFRAPRCGACGSRDVVRQNSIDGRSATPEL